MRLPFRGLRFLEYCLLQEGNIFLSLFVQLDLGLSALARPQHAADGTAVQTTRAPCGPGRQHGGTNSTAGGSLQHLMLEERTGRIVSVDRFSSRREACACTPLFSVSSSWETSPATALLHSSIVKKY